MGTSISPVGWTKPLKRSEKHKARKAYEKSHKGVKYRGADKWKYYYYWLWG